MKYILKILTIVLFCVMLVLSGCVQEDETDDETDQDELSFTTVKISDAPSDNFTSINVTFSQVKVHKTGNENDSGWITFEMEPKTIDMIHLHENNLSEELGVHNLSVGNYSKLWIVVDSATGVLKTTGEEITFDVPSGDLKIQQSFEVKAGNTTIDVELDLDRSILYNTNGNVYKLRPQLGKLKLSYQHQEQEQEQEQEGQEDNGETEESNLLAHWKFDETAGTTAVDSAGNYNGTLIGGTWSEGKKGNAIYLDGVDDYVQLPQTAIDDLGALSQGTIAFWFNYSSLLDSQTIMPIFFIGNQDTNDQDSIFVIEIGHSDTEAETLTTDPTNKNLYVTWTDLTQATDPILCYDTNENQAEDTWIHFALTVGPTGNTGYINGVELDNRIYNFGSSSDQKFLSDIPVKELFSIGYGRTHYQISPNFLYYKGYIDDLRVYNEPLSQTEIQGLL